MTDKNTPKEPRKLHLVGSHSKSYQDLVRALMDSLEQHHTRNRELHQLYLEAQWLLSNAEDGKVTLPTDWELIIFQLVREGRLEKYPEILDAAKELLHMIKTLAHCDDQAS